MDAGVHMTCKEFRRTFGECVLWASVPVSDRPKMLAHYLDCCRCQNWLADEREKQVKELIRSKRAAFHEQPEHSRTTGRPA